MELIVRSNPDSASPPGSLVTSHCDLTEISGKEIIARRGLEAYLFLRYLITLLKIFISLALIILPVLISVNLAKDKGTEGGASGLDQLSWTNVSPAHINRYWVYLTMAVLVVIWVCRIARIKLLYYTELRHKWLVSLEHFGHLSTAIILVTDVPKSLLTVYQLHSMYDIYPHGVRCVSLNQEYSKRRQCIQRRDELVLTLESAETKLIRKAYLSYSRGLAKSSN